MRMSITIERTVSRDAMTVTESLSGYTFTGEAGAHQFVISATRGGEPEALSGTVTANFLRSDNENVAMGAGDCALTDGKAVVELPQACYNVPGRFLLTIYVTNSGVTEAIYSASGNVQRAKSETYVDTGFMPTFDNLTEVAEQFPAVKDAAEDAAAAVSGLDDWMEEAEETLAHAEAAASEAEANTHATTDALAVDVSGGAAYAPDAAAGGKALALKLQIKPIWSGSGIPSVSNARAMSPRTAVILRKAAGVALEQGGLSDGAGAVAASDKRLRTVDYLPIALLGDSTVIDLAGTGRADARARRLYFYDSSKEFLSAVAVDGNALPLTFAGSSIPADAAWFKAAFQFGTAGTVDLLYDGQRMAIDPASTSLSLGDYSVYGGVLDVVNGLLTVTHAYLAPVAANINRNSGAQYYVKASAAPGVKASGSVYSSMFRPMGASDSSSTAGVCYINGSGGIRFNTESEYANVSEMMAAHTGIAFVYELSEPQTYQLTPTEVALLAGENTVYTEDGSAELRFVRRIADAVAAIEHPDVTVSGAAPVITAQAGKRYLCGTLTSLSFTPSATGLCEVIFTSGSTQTTLTGLTGVKMPDWWTGTVANRVYDIMILNGTLGVVTSWAT